MLSKWYQQVGLHRWMTSSELPLARGTALPWYCKLTCSALHRFLDKFGTLSRPFHMGLVLPNAGEPSQFYWCDPFKGRGGNRMAITPWSNDAGSKEIYLERFILFIKISIFRFSIAERRTTIHRHIDILSHPYSSVALPNFLGENCNVFW